MTRTNSYPFIAMLVGVLAALTISPALADKPADNAPTLQSVVNELIQEAEDFEKTGQWRRSKSDYASIVKHKFPIDDVLAQLARTHGRAPHIDAYVKWQLLSFIGRMDMNKATDSRIAAAARAMPRYIPATPPDARVVKILETLGSKTTMNQREKEFFDQARTAFDDHYRQIALINKPAAEYRESFAELQSPSTMLRYMLLLENIEERLRNNHDVKNEVKDFTTRAPFYFRTKDVSPNDRRMIYTRLESLKNVKGQRLELKADKKKSTYEVKPKTLSADNKQIDRLQAILRGEDPDKK